MASLVHSSEQLDHLKIINHSLVGEKVFISVCLTFIKSKYIEQADLVIFFPQ